MITNRTIQAIKPTDKPRWAVIEGAGRGSGRLMLKTMPSGSKSWFFVWYEHGRRKTVKIGSFPATGVREAKAKFAELSAGLDDGTTPASRARRHSGARAATLADVLDLYIADMEAQGRRTFDQVDSQLTYYVRKPHAGLLQVPAHEITEADVVNTIKSVIARSPVQANRTLSYLKRAFKIARSVSRRPRSPAPVGVDFTLIAANPAEYVERDGTAEKVGERVLSIQELRAFLKAVEQDEVLSPGVKAVLTLAATTGCRGSEIRRLRWRDVDMNGRTLTIPADVLKTGQMGGTEKTHTAAIGDIGYSALETAGEAKATAPDNFICPHLKHGGGRRRGSASEDRTKPIAAVLLGRNLKRLLERHQLEPFVVKDLRRTAVTLMAEIGVPHESVCRQVGHAFGNPINAKHYDKSLHLAEKRQAVAALEDWILGRRDLGDVVRLVARGAGP